MNHANPNPNHGYQQQPNQNFNSANASNNPQPINSLTNVNAATIPFITQTSNLAHANNQVPVSPYPQNQQPVPTTGQVGHQSGQPLAPQAGHLQAHQSGQLQVHQSGHLQAHQSGQLQAHQPGQLQALTNGQTAQTPNTTGSHTPQPSAGNPSHGRIDHFFFPAQPTAQVPQPISNTKEQNQAGGAIRHSVRDSFNPNRLPYWATKKINDTAAVVGRLGPDVEANKSNMKWNKDDIRCIQDFLKKTYAEKWQKHYWTWNKLDWYDMSDKEQQKHAAQFYDGQQSSKNSCDSSTSKSKSSAGKNPKFIILDSDQSTSARSSSTASEPVEPTPVVVEAPTSNTVTNPTNAEVLEAITHLAQRTNKIDGILETLCTKVKSQEEMKKKDDATNDASGSGMLSNDEIEREATQERPGFDAEENEK